MKTRVFKYPDGTVCYSTPTSKYQDKENFGACKFPPYCNGLPFVDIDRSDLPPSNSNTGDYHEMIYFDGDCKPGNLKQDKDWCVCLMPTFLVRQKHINYLNKKISDELAKESPDIVEVMRCQNEVVKCMAYKLDVNAKELYQIALDGLARAEKDVTVVRAKLEAKISSRSLK